MTVKDRRIWARLSRWHFQIATTGKPGPVVIDIPKDIQAKAGNPEYPDHVDIRGYKPNETVHIGQLKKAYKMLRHAKRPLILAGGGVNIAGAGDLLVEFAEKMQIPVVTTIMGKGVMPTDHELYIGNSGMHGKYASNKAVSECDVLFSIGTRFNDRITGDLNEFAPHAKIIHVDIDAASISRNVVVDVPITADAKLALEKLTEYVDEPMDTSKWMSQIMKWDDEHPLEMRRDRGFVPTDIMEEINEVFPTGSMWLLMLDSIRCGLLSILDMPSGKKFITSGGLGTMGFGFPAALGAKIGCPDKPVVCITGDGGFQMNMQEMAMAITEKLPVTICILNNYYLGMVRQMQQIFYGKRYEITYLGKDLDESGKCAVADGAEPEYAPDFVKWAESYGAKGIRVRDVSGG